MKHVTNDLPQKEHLLQMTHVFQTSGKQKTS